MNLKDIHTIYFVGIGGIGMSALARYFNGRGVAVHGYDRTATDLTRRLEEEGMQIHYEESVEAIPEGVDLVVYTPAVPDSHAELQHFRANNYPLKKRAEVLGIISRAMKTIGIAGTHGKTTTSSITTHLLRSGGVDATAFLGGIMQNYQSNFVEGKSDWVVVEADEFDRSFLQLDPDLAVITSTDADHLDIYGDADSIIETGFKAYVAKIKPGGHLWVQHQFAATFQYREGLRTYGVNGGTYRAENVRVENGFFVFDYKNPEQQIEGLQFPLPGRHNVENATAAISIALELGVEPQAIREGLLSFGGIQRRYEQLYRTAEVAYFDDYAHHPSELNAAIGAARELFPNKKITGVFQPHLYSRTRDFADGFAAALDKLDEAILLPIYPAREEPIPGVTAEMLLNKMQEAEKCLLQKEELLPYLEKQTTEVLLTLGAGDIANFRKPIATMLAKKAH